MIRPKLFLLDTNTCIYIMNSEPQAVRERMAEATRAGNALGISSITRHELWFGVWRSARHATNAKRVTEFLDVIHTFPFGDSAAEASAEVWASLASTGQPIGHYDVLIAGHTLSLNAVLVTNNMGEFSRVAGLNSEDWTK